MTAPAHAITVQSLRTAFIIVTQGTATLFCLERYQNLPLAGEPFSIAHCSMRPKSNNLFAVWPQAAKALV